MLRSLICLILLIIYLPIGEIKAIESKPRITKEINLHLTHTIDLPELESGRVVVQSKLVNLGQETVTFLPWNSPFDNHVNGEIFDVFLLETGFSKQKLDYQGRLVKRQAPMQSDLISLKVGQTVEQSLDITKSYDFCSGKRYSLSYSTKFLITDLQINIFSELASDKVLEFDINNDFKECTK